VIVHTTSGPIDGTAEGGVSVFRGIPYAAPPVGELRFRPPEAMPDWTEVRAAHAFGPQAPQNMSPLASMFGMEVPVCSEDCLTLNVWTSDPAGPARPVMVWIHGGGFTQGTAGTPLYDGAGFAEDGVVLVSMNYRLGALGFLHLADFGGSTGNLGMLDQLAALQWVHDNIAAFGGDPDNVTIFGESAGAMSVAVHLAWPASAGLFRRAILQSGALQNYGLTGAATDITRRVLAECGLDLSAPVGIDQINGLPTDTFLAAQKAVGEVNVVDATINFGPVFDGAVLPADPMARLAAGAAADVDILIGATRDELSVTVLSDPDGLVADLDAAAERIRPLFGDRAPAIVAAYEAARPGAPPSEVYCALATDRFCRLPALRLAEAHIGGGGRAHVFEFAWPSPAFGGILRAFHGIDVPFVFDHLDDPIARLMMGGEHPQKVADAMHSAWVAFAKTGDPGWPAYDEAARTSMVFDDPCEVIDDLRGAERTLWDGVV
jgi:para-nitrobenzyl esterase